MDQPEHHAPLRAVLLQRRRQNLGSQLDHRPNPRRLGEIALDWSAQRIQVSHIAKSREDDNSSDYAEWAFLITESSVLATSGLHAFRHGQGVCPSGERCTWGFGERVDWAFQFANNIPLHAHTTGVS